MSKKPYIAALVVAAVIVGGVWWGFSRSGDSGAGDVRLGSNAGSESESAAAPEAGAAETPLPFDSFPLTETYHAASSDGFSFKYPKDFSVKAPTVTLQAEPEGARIYTIENAKGEGVQITLSPFDETGDTLTPERIENETGITVSSPEPVMGDDGKQIGLGFIALGTAMGKSREIWFVARGMLFQLSSPIRYDALAKAILRSIQFENIEERGTNKNYFTS